MQVALKSCGNPDHGQDPDRPYYFSEPDRIVEVSSFEEASRICRKFIEKNDLGGGNWSGGQIYVDGQFIAKVNYVGRIMSKDGVEIPIIK
jgi:hypothetical protein